MKKLFALCAVLGLAVVASAATSPLMFTIGQSQHINGNGEAYTDAVTGFGVAATDGLVLADFFVETTAGLDWSGFTAGDYEVSSFSAGPDYAYDSGRYGVIGKAWGGAPTVINEGTGWVSVFCGQGADAGVGSFDIFTGVVLSDPSLSLSRDYVDGAVAINLVAKTVNDGTTVMAGGEVLDTIYVVPEPMTMSLIGAGALALIRRRRHA